MVLRTLPEGEDDLHQAPHLQAADPRKRSILGGLDEDGRGAGTVAGGRVLRTPDFGCRDLRQLAGFGH